MYRPIMQFTVDGQLLVKPPLHTTAQNAEVSAEVHDGEVEEKNILLSSTSSEEEYYSTPQKNKSHDLFDVSK